MQVLCSHIRRATPRGGIFWTRVMSDASKSNLNQNPPAPTGLASDEHHASGTSPAAPGHGDTPHVGSNPDVHAPLTCRAAGISNHKRDKRTGYDGESGWKGLKPHVLRRKADRTTTASTIWQERTTAHEPYPRLNNPASWPAFYLLPTQNAEQPQHMHGMRYKLLLCE